MSEKIKDPIDLHRIAEAIRNLLTVASQMFTRNASSKLKPYVTELTKLSKEMGVSKSGDLQGTFFNPPQTKAPPSSTESGASSTPKPGQ